MYFIDSDLADDSGDNFWNFEKDVFMKEKKIIFYQNDIESGC